MKLTDLAALTVAELKALAKKTKIALSSRAKKADIVKALAGSRGSASSTAKAKKANNKKDAATAKTKKKVAATKTAGKKPAQTKQNARPSRETKASAVAQRSIPAARGEWRAPIGSDQERIAGAKYFTGPATGERVSPSLPLSYGDERIVVMSRDPFVLFGYWEISQERIDRERAARGNGSRLCVRIYDTTGVSFDGTNATAIFDQEVYERTGSWYFHLGRPSHRFCADIGLLTPDGRFRTLMRSNTVSMPRETASDLVDDRWAVSDEAFLRLHGLTRTIGGLSSAQVSAQVHEALRVARMHEISSHGLFSPQATKKK